MGRDTSCPPESVLLSTQDAVTSNLNHIREVSKVFDYNFTPRAYSWVWGPVPRARATSWLCLWFVQFIRTTFFQAPTKISKVFCWLLIEMTRNDNRQLIRQLIIR